ncbi:hypothetical protein [Croceicoccus ponticola]|uniref:hypothetical protein n=1 Tax=Croceicoccus ponticola TaxID=2217664 RepID=UPI000FD8CEDC|nr:hypothetical protein [Croceicoccus ponticola]
MATLPAPAAAQHSGGASTQAGGHDSGHDTGEDSGHTDDGHDKGPDAEPGKGGKGRAPGEAGSRSPRGMQDIFRSVAAAEDGGDDTSDRPDWAGAKGGRNEHGGKPSTGGDNRGDLYGDMYVILRDEDGEPILTEEGWVQPVDADGVPLELDEEGALVDPTLAIEVVLGRLNVGRSPTSVLNKRADEIVTLLNDADEITVDAAGRLVVVNYVLDENNQVIDTVYKTIDAPLDNLALYVALMTEGTIPGVTDLPGEEYDFLVDGEFTGEDLVAATSLLAAASDKYETLSLDAVAYMNAILGINTVTEGTITYSSMDYSDYSYDRSDTYDAVIVTVLVQQDDGSWVAEPVNIYDEVFGEVDYVSEDGFDGFAQAVDDAREVISYIHEYAIPADQIDSVVPEEPTP